MCISECVNQTSYWDRANTLGQTEGPIGVVGQCLPVTYSNYKYKQKVV